MNRRLEELKHLYRNEAEQNAVRAAQAIDTGIRRAGERMEKKPRRRWARAVRGCAAAAAAVALGFFLMVNAWPAFAAAAEKVPVLGDLVRLVSLDRGLRAAVGNGYYSSMEQHLEFGNGKVKISFEAFTADESTLTLFYYVECSGEDFPYDELHIKNRFLDENGKELEASGTMGPVDQGENRTSGQWWCDQFYMADGIPLPEKLTVEVNACFLTEEGDIPFSTWKKTELGKASFPLEIPESLRLKGETIPLGKTIGLPGGETIELVDLTVNPLRTKLRVRCEENIHLRLTLEDEKGVEYRSSVSMGAGEPGLKIYLIESSFFEKGRELYLKMAEYTQDPGGRLITLSIDEETGKPAPTGIDWLIPDSVEMVEGGVTLWYRVQSDGQYGYDPFGWPLLDAGGINVRDDYTERMEKEMGAAAFGFSAMQVSDGRNRVGIGIPDGYAFPMTIPLSFGEAVTLRLDPIRLK